MRLQQKMPRVQIWYCQPPLKKKKVTRLFIWSDYSDIVEHKPNNTF